MYDGIFDLYIMARNHAFKLATPGSIYCQDNNKITIECTRIKQLYQVDCVEKSSLNMRSV